MPTIEVFADVCCPFTHVGLRRLVEHWAAVGRDDVRLRVRAWPLELVNGEPLDPDFIDEEVEELRAQVASDLFLGFDRARFPATSLPALTLAAHAYAVGVVEGEAVSLALRAALFEDGRDIADERVLGEIADATDVSLPGPDAHAQVIDDWHEGQRRCVIGSPHFFVGGDDFFCPSLDISRVDGHLRIRSDREAFDAFVERCFSTRP